MVAVWMSMAARSCELTPLTRNAIERHIDKNSKVFYKITFDRAKATSFKKESHCICAGDLETAAIGAYLHIFDTYARKTRQPAYGARCFQPRPTAA